MEENGGSEPRTEVTAERNCAVKNTRQYAGR
jgi:hypothetical protein